MIKIPTVLVLGAGASVPFGLPSGQILVDIICHLLVPGPSPHWIPNWLRDPLTKTFVMLRDKFANDAVESFARKLAKSGEESIDSFLEDQTGEFLEIGKGAIAAVLLAFEMESALYYDSMRKRLENRFIEGGRKNEIENNWYQLLWSALSAPFDTTIFELSLSIMTGHWSTISLPV